MGEYSTRKGLVEAHNFAKKEIEKMGRTVLLSGYVGSQHLDLSDEKSDYDFLFYVLPTKEELYMRTLLNEDYQFTEDIGAQVLSWFGVGEQMYQVTFNLFEILVDPLYVSEKVKKEVEKMIKLMSTNEEYTKRLIKNVYFTGTNIYKKSKVKPTKGSRVQHYKEGVDYKNIAKAWLYYRLLSSQLHFWGVYKNKELPEWIKEEYTQIREEQVFTDYETLDKFYGEEQIQKMVPLGYVKEGYFEGVNKILSEPLKYVYIE